MRANTEEKTQTKNAVDFISATKERDQHATWRADLAAAASGDRAELGWATRDGASSWGKIAVSPWKYLIDMYLTGRERRL